MFGKKSYIKLLQNNLKTCSLRITEFNSCFEVQNIAWCGFDKDVSWRYNQKNPKTFSYNYYTVLLAEQGQHKGKALVIGICSQHVLQWSALVIG